MRSCPQASGSLRVFKRGETDDIYPRTAEAVQTKKKERCVGLMSDTISSNIASFLLSKVRLCLAFCQSCRRSAFWDPAANALCNIQHLWEAFSSFQTLVIKKKSVICVYQSVGIAECCVISHHALSVLLWLAVGPSKPSNDNVG